MCYSNRNTKAGNYSPLHSWREEGTIPNMSSSSPFSFNWTSPGSFYNDRRCVLLVHWLDKCRILTWEILANVESASYTLLPTAPTLLSSGADYITLLLYALTCKHLLSASLETSPRDKKWGLILSSLISSEKNMFIFEMCRWDNWFVI